MASENSYARFSLVDNQVTAAQRLLDALRNGNIIAIAAIVAI